MKSRVGGLKKWILITLSSFIIIFISSNSINANWTSITPPYVSSDWDLSGVHFISPNEGWAVGSEYDGVNLKGALLHYLNGTWTFVTPPIVSSSWWLNSVHFTSSNEGWAGGYDSINDRVVLVHYLNGTWSSVTPPDVSSIWDLYSIHFTSSNEGWAVGCVYEIIYIPIRPYITIKFGGFLFHYLNGIWRSAPPPDVSSNWQLLSIHFTSSNEGWAVGSEIDGGVLLHYSNGIWSGVTPPDVSSNWWLKSVHFTSSNEGWAVGNDITNGRGVLLKYSLPDLTGMWDSLSESCRTIYGKTRCSINGKFNIQNIGDKDVPSIKINFYLSDDPLYDGGDTYLFQRTMRNISAGESKSVLIRTNLPSDMSVKGKYIVAVIDPDNVLEESDKNNNQVAYGPMP